MFGSLPPTFVPGAGVQLGPLTSLVPPPCPPQSVAATMGPLCFAAPSSSSTSVQIPGGAQVGFVQPPPTLVPAAAGSAGPSCFAAPANPAAENPAIYANRAAGVTPGDVAVQP